MYEVGHGDCFLLRFNYPRGERRHVLIDFGTTAANWRDEDARLRPIASDIATECDGKLDAIVATHRHRDHIGGFAQSKDPRAPGSSIAALRPTVLVRPGPEHPDCPDAAGIDEAAKSVHRALQLAGRDDSELLKAIPNRRALAGLHTLGERRVYVYAGDDCGLAPVLPGVDVRVLGPGRLDRRRLWPELAGLGGEDAELAWAEGKPTADGELLFPDAERWHPCLAPPQTRWFVDRLHRLKTEQLLAAARSLNERVNNGSVILSIDAAGHRMIFPGDAEVDAWASALHSRAARDRVSRATVWKIGHHGSPRATPLPVWDLLRHRRGRLTTMLSTRKGMPGSEGGLYRKFRKESLLIDTPKLRIAGRMFTDILLEPPQAARHPLKLAA